MCAPLPVLSWIINYKITFQHKRHAIYIDFSPKNPTSFIHKNQGRKRKKERGIRKQ